MFGKFGPLNNLVPRAFPLKNGWGRVGTRLSAELCVIVIVFFLPYPVKFYFIYLVQSLARSHWPLWRNDVCTAAPLPSKEKWIGERDCLLLSVFVLFSSGTAFTRLLPYFFILSSAWKVKQAFVWKKKKIVSAGDLQMGERIKIKIG